MAEKIIVNIYIGGGCETVHQVRVDGQGGPDDDSQRPNAEPAAPGAGGTAGKQPAGDVENVHDAADVAAIAALEACGVQHPEIIMGSFRPERILAVCNAAMGRRDTLKNVPGFIVQALHKCWKV